MEKVPPCLDTTVGHRYTEGMEPPQSSGFGPPAGFGQSPGGLPPAPAAKPRKEQILIFTILGWAVCGIFSIVGYQMAKTDLEMMAVGEMDDTDHGLINICKILNLVVIGLMVFGILAGCCMVIASMGTSGASYSY